MCVNYVKDSLVSRPNCIREPLERSPSKPLARHPSTAQGDLLPLPNPLLLLCLIESSMKQRWCFVLESGMLLSEHSCSICESWANFLFEPGIFLNPAVSRSFRREKRILYKHHISVASPVSESYRKECSHVVGVLNHHNYRMNQQCHGIRWYCKIRGTRQCKGQIIKRQKLEIFRFAGVTT